MKVLIEGDPAHLWYEELIVALVVLSGLQQVLKMPQLKGGTRVQAIAIGIRARGSVDQINDAIVVDVTCSSYRVARKVIRIKAGSTKAVLPFRSQRLKMACIAVLRLHSGAPGTRVTAKERLFVGRSTRRTSVTQGDRLVLS